MEKKVQRYKTTSIVLNVFGYIIFGICTFGGFLLYEGVTNFEEIKNVFSNFTVFQEGSYKLNPVLTIYFLIVIGIFLVVVLKKNKSFFKDKVSFGLIIGTLVFYLLYCTVSLALFTLAGASLGSVINEFIFSPLSKRSLRLYNEQRDVNLEYEKEKRRISARQDAELENNGNV